MSISTKIVRGSDERKSRLHNRRGQLVPLAELLALPRLVASRRGGRQDGPWMARGAVSYLNQTLDNNMSLLELGSGDSTLWYGMRTRNVVSVEPDERWCSTTRAATAHLLSVRIVEGPIGMAGASLLASNKFDVVVVDHRDEPDFSRMDALRALGDRVRTVVLDDSDRTAYSAADSLMKGWERRRFVSYRSRPLIPTETTVYTRR